MNCPILAMQSTKKNTPQRIRIPIFFTMSLMDLDNPYTLSDSDMGSISSMGSPDLPSHNVINSTLNGSSMHYGDSTYNRKHNVSDLSASSSFSNPFLSSSHLDCTEDLPMIVSVHIYISLTHAIVTLHAYRRAV